ncbi:MAG: aminomethyltransferase beta-barrel domain-containing protein, partial [Fidelibacterota bacterium]
AAELPWYVSEKRLEDNTLVVVQGQKNPALYSRGLTAENIHWIGAGKPGPEAHITAKIRYRQPDQECGIVDVRDDRVEVEFENPQFAVAPGQSIVFYDQAECLGGAIIERAHVGKPVEV